MNKRERGRDRFIEKMEKRQKKITHLEIREKEIKEATKLLLKRKYQENRRIGKNQMTKIEYIDKVCKERK